MSFLIRKVAVLGSGVMGSGIAAHLANAGIPSLLLDIVPPKAAEGEDTSSRKFRDRFARSNVEKLHKQKPASLFTPGVADLIEVGNFDDDMARIAECDWIVEVVVERMDVKQKVFAQVERYRRPGTIISSNTSGLSIRGMLEGRSEEFCRHFLVTHFFNPVRYMKLLELVAGEQTLPEVMAAIHRFGEETLGKGIVYGKDTTNFIGNRIGVYGIMKTMAEMQKAELTVEEVDKIFGPAMGRPGSAIFRTADIVGLDTFIHVSQNCYDTLAHDEEREVFAIPTFLRQMAEKNLLGEKSGAGFYKRVSKGAEKEIQSIDLATLEYRPQKKVRFDSLGAARSIEELGPRIKAILGGADKAAVFAEKCTLTLLAYSSRRIPEIADDVVNVDRAMRWGFAYEMGPFETWDVIGVAHGIDRMKALGIAYAPWVDEMLAAGRTSFYAVDGTVDTYWDIPSKSAKAVPQSKRVQKIEYLRRGNRKIRENFSATLWDMQDGVAALEFHTKMNAIDDDIVALISESVDLAERDFRGLVIGSDAQNFSAGANIMGLLMMARAGSWEQIRAMVKGFQDANQKLRYSRVPTVAATAGFVFGGGCECAMGCNAIQAASESYIGLVEFGVGLIPGGGGNMQLLRNVFGSFSDDPEFDAFPFLKKVFLSIGLAKVATSAEEARNLGFLKPSDGISLNRDFILSDAKARAIGMAEAGFQPPRATKFRLPGRTARATFEMSLYDMFVNKQISEHDKLIGTTLAGVLTGGETGPAVAVTEQHLLDLELEAFMSLIGTEKTQARLEHMLQNGKPLRN